MDPFLMVLLLLALTAGIVWGMGRRRRAEPPEDEWVLPPETGDTPSTTAQSPLTRPVGSPAPAPREVFDRDALTSLDRTLDPSKWDDSPDNLVGTDPSDPDAPAAAPREVFDRSTLENRAKDVTDE